MCPRHITGKCDASLTRQPPFSCGQLRIKLLPVVRQCSIHKLDSVSWVLWHFIFLYKHTPDFNWVMLHSFLTLTLDGGAWSTLSQPLFSRKEPQYPLDRRLGGSQSWYGHLGEEGINCTSVSMSLFNNNVLEEHWKLQKLGILYSTQNLKLMLHLLHWLIWLSTHLCKVVHSRGFIFTYSSMYFSQMDRHQPLQLLPGVVLHSGSINEVVGSRDSHLGGRLYLHLKLW